MTPDRWMQTLCEGTVSEVLRLYTPDAVLVPTYSQTILRGHAELRAYFIEFMNKEGLCGRIDETFHQGLVVSGTYTFHWREKGLPLIRRDPLVWDLLGLDVPPKDLRHVRARFTFVFTPDGLIQTHHSSETPEVEWT